jgi:hypothetical protein
VVYRVLAPQICCVNLFNKPKEISKKLKNSIMKKSIILTALVSVLSIGSLFANTTSNSETTNDTEINKAIVVKGLTSKMVVTVSVLGDLDKNPLVSINDSDGNNLFKKTLTGKAGETQGFNISNLGLGDYTLSVTSGKQTVEKQVRVLELDGKKSYFIFE